MIAAATKKEPYFIVTEFVSGGSLEGLLAKHESGLPSFQVKQLASDILVGLVQIHSRGMLHRDLKPGNILLAREERLRAKIAGENEPHPQFRNKADSMS
ncbi:MAG: protein kinase [Thermoplasmata archaeon]|uniref:Protein kinase n=1 Tax=Candidatus Sysuiplasma superficiale TaxID=2823368 RepID=A0A8J7YXU3_9ARCH|nr:protein kinase [Candidatus Sysuiplasma superficiale]